MKMINIYSKQLVKENELRKLLKNNNYFSLIEVYNYMIENDEYSDGK